MLPGPCLEVGRFMGEAGPAITGLACRC